MTFAAVAVAGVGAATAIGTSIANGQAAKGAAAQESANSYQNTVMNNQLATQYTGQANQLLDPYANTGSYANATLANMLGQAPVVGGQAAKTWDQPAPTSVQELQAQANELSRLTGINPGAPTSLQDLQAKFGQLVRAYNAMPQNQAVAGTSQQNAQTGQLLANFTPQDYQNSPLYTPMVNSLAELQATPGYQFQLDQGLQSVNNSASAKGSLLSGANLKAIDNYSQGLASTGYQAAWQRAQQAYQQAFSNFNTNKLNTYNILSGQQQQGQNAATNQGRNLMQLSSYIQGNNSANNQYQNQAINTGLQGTSAQNNGIGSGINSLVGGIANSGLLDNLGTTTTPSTGNTAGLSGGVPTNYSINNGTNGNYLNPQLQSIG